MRLLGYVRVSTDEQARAGHSLAQQPERLAAYCLAHQHELVDVVVEADGISGSVPLERRPGGAALLHRIKAGEADGILVIRIERLFRDLLDGLAFFRGPARRRNIAVHSLAEHIDTSTAAGRLALNIHLLLADHDRDKGAERTAEVMQGLRDGGRVFGHVPYGCLAIDGALFRDPAQWEQRAAIVRMHRQGLSLSTIRAALRELRQPAPSGGALWPKSTLAELIRTHESLAHLPLHAGELAAPAAAAPDAPASHPGDPKHATRH
jgi:DNA invertase Pin-like site-specific DNA recombinase